MTNAILMIDAIITKLYSDIQSWSYTNSVIVNAGGFTIGYSTYYFITGILALFTPIYIILNKNITIFGNKIGINKTGIIYNILNFFINIISLTGKWLITLLITFLLLEYILNIKLLGLKSNVKADQKKDFIISKTEAKNNEPIIENSKKIEKKNEKELLIGTQILKTEEESLNKLNIKKEAIEFFDIKKGMDYNNLIKKLL
tara:strand:+ start:2387 stop:2989 length:603 start_codon:yes stop_codon:yes gene_type:complete